MSDKIVNFYDKLGIKGAVLQRPGRNITCSISVIRFV